MSSLVLSLVLLIAIAIVAALLYNLRQSRWPGRRLGAAAGAERPESSARRSEPRLGEDIDATRAGAARHGVEGGTTGPAQASQPAERAGRAEFAPETRSQIRQECADAAISAALLPEAAEEDAPFAPDPGDRRADPGRDGASAAPSAASDVAAAAALTSGAAATADAAPGASARSSGAHAAEARAPVGDPAALTASTAQAPTEDVQQTAMAPGAVLSDAADCVIELLPETPVSGERLQMIAMRMRRAGSKPIAFDARPVGGEDFEAPADGASYALVRVGILLVNRHGALNAMEFSDFIGAVQVLMESLPAQADIPEMTPVLARARELDSICAQLDVQIGLSVETAAAIETAQLTPIAHDLGMVEQISDRYVLPGAHGSGLFTLAFADTPERVTFLLDVPRVPSSLMPFERMVQAATTCARRLGGSLVDDGGRALTQASLGQIARQLGQRYESLEAIGLPAGSSLACKVFN